MRRRHWGRMIQRRVCPRGKPSALCGFPLRGRDRKDGAADDLGHVGAGRYRKADHRLQPIRERAVVASHHDLEGKCRSSRRSARDAGRCGRLARRRPPGSAPARGRQFHHAEHDSDERAQRHRAHADQDVHHEARAEIGQPVEQVRAPSVGSASAPEEASRRRVP